MKADGTPEIYAIDFDGTLVVTDWPTIVAPKLDIITKVLRLKEQGDKIILWTCRTDEKLTEAVEYCTQFGLVFDAVNENLPEQIAMYGNDCRKIGADYYVDDKALNVLDF